MKSGGFRERLQASANDFVLGVKPALEAQLKCKIFSIEDLEASELITKLDQQGIDAFGYDSQGYIRTLASRMNYHESSAKQRCFTFRYALWSGRFRAWDLDREYMKKLLVSRQPSSFRLFPVMHVESFCKKKNSGEIGWSVAALTKEILEFAENNLDNKKAVRVFEPRSGERRQVLSVSVSEFEKHHNVINIRPCA